VLPGNLIGKVEATNKLTSGVCGARARPGAGTTALATYADHFYKGNAAAVTRKFGKEQ